MNNEFAGIFNNKQIEVIGHWIEHRPDILLQDGAVGSGKTYVMLWLFPMYVSEYKNRHLDFLITGQSVGSIDRNIISALLPIWGSELDTKIKGSSQHYVDWYGNRVWLFSTKNADSHEAFQGMNAQGHLGNEITLSHYNSFQEILARVRLPDAKFFWDCNPASPNHHLYKNYIKIWEKEKNTKEFARFNYEIYDNDKEHNGFLPDSYIKRLEKRYSGIWKQQKIFGQWVAIEGQVYFPEKLNYYDSERSEERRVGKECRSRWSPDH